MVTGALDYHTIAQRLNRTEPLQLQAEERRLAAVALILRQSGAGLELFFIQRAHHPDDPWSGNIGFPGGGVEQQDASLRHTAERETLEEVGLDLADACCLGRLSDIVGHNLPVRVSCYVYGLHGLQTPVFSPEVQDAFWIDMEELFAEERQVIEQVSFDGCCFEVPAIRIHPEKPVLWGITYRLVSQFRQILESDLQTSIPYELPL